MALTYHISYLASDGTGKCDTLCSPTDSRCDWGGCCPSGYACDSSVMGCSISNGTSTSTTSSAPVTTTATPTSTISSSGTKGVVTNLGFAKPSGQPLAVFTGEATGLGPAISLFVGIIGFWALCGGWVTT